MQSHWIFAFETTLRPEYIVPFQNALKKALDAWQAHGVKVTYLAELKYGQFVLVQTTNNAASGCSIDWMSRTIEALAQQFEVKVADPTQVFYFKDDVIKSLTFRLVPEALLAGEIDAETIIMDQTVVQENTFQHWEKRLADSWLNRYIPVLQS